MKNNYSIEKVHSNGTVQYTLEELDNVNIKEFLNKHIEIYFDYIIHLIKTLLKDSIWVINITSVDIIPIFEKQVGYSGTTYLNLPIYYKNTKLEGDHSELKTNIFNRVVEDEEVISQTYATIYDVQNEFRSFAIISDKFIPDDRGVGSDKSKNGQLPPQYPLQELKILRTKLKQQQKQWKQQHQEQQKEKLQEPWQRLQEPWQPQLQEQRQQQRREKLLQQQRQRRNKQLQQQQQQAQQQQLQPVAPTAQATVEGGALEEQPVPAAQAAASLESSPGSSPESSPESSPKSSFQSPAASPDQSGPSGPQSSGKLGEDDRLFILDGVLTYLYIIFNINY